MLVGEPLCQKTNDISLAFNLWPSYSFGLANLWSVDKTVSKKPVAKP